MHIGTDGVSVMAAYCDRVCVCKVHCMKRYITASYIEACVSFTVRRGTVPLRKVNLTHASLYEEVQYLFVKWTIQTLHCMKRYCASSYSEPYTRFTAWRSTVPLRTVNLTHASLYEEVLYLFVQWTLHTLHCTKRYSEPYTRFTVRRGTVPIRTVNHTHAHPVTICRHNTDTVCTDVHCWTRLLILAKHWLQLHDDGSYVNRNMLQRLL